MPKKNSEASAKNAYETVPLDTLSIDPTNAFEVALNERLVAMQRELNELRSRLDWLLTLIVGAAITNVVIALLQ